MARRNCRRRKNKRPLAKYRKQGKYKKTNLTLVKGPQVVPDRLFVKLPYRTFVSFTTGIFQEHIWRINGCNDIDLTTTGHQPKGWDQWKNFYGSYRVHACKVSATFINRSTDPATAALTLSTDSVGFSNLSDQLEASYTKSNMISASGGADKCHLNMFTKVKAPLGLRKLDLYEDTSASVVSDPTRVLYLISTMGVTIGTGTVNGVMEIKFVQYVELFNRKDLGQS